MSQVLSKAEAAREKCAWPARVTQGNPWCLKVPAESNLLRAVDPERLTLFTGPAGQPGL